ncbi:hypothetical protein FRC12_022053, partial [Ceratobasidium sp. 428]
MPPWSKLLKSSLSSNASKSSLCLSPDARSPYNESSLKVNGTSSELNLDQQKIRRLRSIPSRLNRSTKATSNASTDTFHTADQERLSDSSQPSESSQPVHIDDVTEITLPDREDTAKTFAERAWNEDPSFVEREKLVEWLGSPTEIRQQA